jgi:hypothetical protein
MKKMFSQIKMWRIAFSLILLSLLVIQSVWGTIPAIPSSPTPSSPGSSSEPGSFVSSVTPTLYWSQAQGADYYALAISKYPYGSSNIVYNPQQIYGTSIAVPSNTLIAGEKYRWNMQAHGSGGWSGISSTLYFMTPAAATPTPTPSPIQPPSSPTPSVTTEAANSISATSATLNANLASTGGVTCYIWFQYGSSTSYGTNTEKSTAGAPASISIPVSGLAQGTTYHYRVVARNNYETVRGKDQTFTTTLNQQINPRATLVVTIARNYVDSRDWSVTSDKSSIMPHYGRGTYKCNLFVWEVMREADINIPLFQRKKNGEVINYPPTSSQWADPCTVIPNWVIVNSPLPGDIATDGEHMGVVSVVSDKEKKTISAATAGLGGWWGLVVENNWGFRDNNDHMIFRRYVGK